MELAGTPLYKQIQAEIRRVIASGKLEAGSRLPSESELMSQYYVSSITARNALRGLADEGLIYRIQGKGSFVAPSAFRSDANGLPEPKVGVILPTMATHVEQLYLIHLEREFRQANCQLWIGNSHESPAQETQLVQTFIRRGAQGMIIFPTVSEEQNALIRQLIARKFPIVLIDRTFRNSAAPAVVSENTVGAYEATQHLLECCGEYICMFHYPVQNSALSMRIAGFMKALKDRGVRVHAGHSCLIDDSKFVFADGEQRLALIYAAIRKHLQQHPELTGIFTANAEIARVASLVLNEQPALASRNYRIVSFDNPHLPGVSFVIQDVRAIAGEATRLLLAQLRGETVGGVRKVPCLLVKAPPMPNSFRDMSYIVPGINP